MFILPSTSALGEATLLDTSASFPYQTIAVTGGTGTFGWAFLTYMRQHFPEVNIRILSRHEDLQVHMRATFGDKHVSYLLGDVRDLERLRIAFRGVECVIHAAALKHVDRSEYDAEEFWRTNILGTSNVIRACIWSGVDQAIILSSDKAVHSVNVYGSTKAVAEKLFVQANQYSPHGTRFSAVRYGNVMGARGSVVKHWRDALAHGQALLVTDPAMSRFWLSPEDAVRLVVWTVGHGLRGGVVIPHLPAFTLGDLRQAMQPEPHWETIGRRPGEKVSELLMTADEQARAYFYAPSSRVPVLYVVPPLVQAWGESSERALWAIPPTGLAYGRCDASPQVPYDSAAWPWRLRVDDLRGRLETV